MASSSTTSLESVIKSEQFQFRRVPNQSIPTVIVTNDVTSTNYNNENVDSNGISVHPGTPTKTDQAKQTDLPTINKQKFGRVIISLDNPILPLETIENTPSVADGLDRETEHDLRITGCKLIQISGVLLRLPQVAMATGQVLFQRYYYSKSFVRFPMEITAMACVVLASKVEEAPRRIRDIINVFHNMKQIRLQQPPVPMLLNEAYVNMKNQVIKAERRILKELGFCVHVKHPHKYIITVAEILGNSKNTELIQAAWSYMNDCLHTNVFVRFPPETIACACIHLSARVLRVPLPTKPQWYLVFGVDSDTIEDVCKTILLLYTRTPLPQEELEEKVELARKAVDDAKLKAKAQLQAQSGLAGEASLDSIIDSRTNSPIKYGEAAGTASSSKSLEVLSVINRLKQQITNAKTSPLRSSSNQACSNPSSAINSTSSTPQIKLEKSPRTLVVPPNKRSRSPSPRDRRKNSRERNETDSFSSGDDSRNQEKSSSKRYRNGHANNQDNFDEYKESRYRESDNQYRSRSPPRSYISSTVSITSNVNNSDYIPSKYRRRDSHSRSPSYESEQYNSLRYKSSKSSTNYHRERTDRYEDRHTSNSTSSRHDHHRIRKTDYDNNYTDNHRDRRDNRDRYDESYSRSRSPYTSSGGRHRDEYRSRSSNRNKSKY